MFKKNCFRFVSLFFLLTFILGSFNFEVPFLSAAEDSEVKELRERLRNQIKQKEEEISKYQRYNPESYITEKVRANKKKPPANNKPASILLLNSIFSAPLS